MQMTNEGVQ